jgi:hypothetical protein
MKMRGRNDRSSRARRAVQVGVGTAVLLTGALATPAAAAGTGAAGGGFDYANKASYILDMRSAGLEFEDHIPAVVYQDVGYSGVNLSHDIGEAQGRCESDGATYWLGQYVEEAVLGKGAAPPDAGSVQGGYQNPVYSRDVKPNIAAGNSLSDRSPGITNYLPPGQRIAPIPSDGTPVYVKAHCDSDVKGSGSGNVADLVKNADLVGSTTTSNLDRATGVYTTTARAYVTGIKNAGDLNTVSSFMQVSQKPDGSQPLVTYRLSFFTAAPGGSRTAFGRKGFTFSGNNVPADQLTKQFNSQAATLSAAGSALGPLGFQVLAPKTGVQGSTEAGTTGLHYITAPAIQGEAGLKARNGTVGQDQYARFGSITFTGIYNQP